MYGLLGFGSIEEELTFIAVLSVILVILLLCEHRQKQLDKERKGLNGLIFDIGMLIKHLHKCWRKKQQQKEAGE